jgi:hypothetical protein
MGKLFYHYSCTRLLFIINSITLSLLKPILSPAPLFDKAKHSLYLPRFSVITTVLENRFYPLTWKIKSI